MDRANILIIEGYVEVVVIVAEEIVWCLSVKKNKQTEK